MRFILHHLADTETVLYDRIRRVISEGRQGIWAFDHDAWAGRLGYSSVPLAVSQRIFSAVREAVVHQARAHYEQNGHLEFVHSEAGVRSLRDEFEKVAWHNERHLAQIECALALDSGHLRDFPERIERCTPTRIAASPIRPDCRKATRQFFCMHPPPRRRARLIH